ncbi:hypothetical protein, partial [Mycobacterium alsense]|uniref:hypothetical protein n=1 Tax=Mycobacterium alsense TaxID=324058 RepID=UPI0021F275FF
AAFWVDRRQRRRAAIAARADHEHRKLMARAILAPQPKPPRGRINNNFRISCCPLRARGADHWSNTAPIRS